MKSFLSDVEAMREQLIAWRRDLHRHPELAFEEVRTAGIVSEVLNDLGLEVQNGVGKTGVVGILEGNQGGPTVLVRADMDALPINEMNQTDYVSLTPNKMHACGHDGHTAIALTVASILAKQRDLLNGRIKFIFQPAEEVAGGAKAMIEDGALSDPKPDVSLGLHLWNDMPVGTIAVTDGPMMASAADLKIIIQGKGGHAAQPQQTHDPIVASAQIVNALQTIISRNVHPLKTGVVSITSIHGGDAFNVIPPHVEMLGTIRAYDMNVYENMVQRLNDLVTNIAEAFNCTAEIEIELLTIPVINDPQVGDRLRQGFSQIAPQLQILTDERTMGAEDVSFFLKEAPGVYFFVGSANSDRGLDYPHHHPQFDIDEESLVIGASLLASAVGDYVLPD